MKHKLFNVLVIVALLSSTIAVLPAGANPPVDEDTIPTGQVIDQTVPAKPGTSISKNIDQPNPKDYMRMRERQRLLEAAQKASARGLESTAADLDAQAALLAQTGEDRVLVILVEFAGTDTFTWNPGDTWDPLGIYDPNEDTGTVGDCSLIITQTKTFTYTGPLHNMIEQPRALDDRSGDTIWTTDFEPQWFTDFMFGNGVAISYTMQDGTPIYESFMGQSVRDYYSDLSGGVYTITGDVIGWLGLPHSTWWYAADDCPGGRTNADAGWASGIPGAGSPDSLVTDALDALNAISNTIPGFDWHNYDLDGDGIIDRLWIVHAGYGEEDSTTLLNRDPVVQGSFVTPAPEYFYGEAAMWSHSGGVTPPYAVTTDVVASAYIMMPENGGIGVFAHEYGHNLGADDLYAYGEGNTSTGFWSLMSDDWTGYPIGFEPPAPDPWHLDNWGWLEPYVVNDATQVHTVTVGQASYFDTNTAPGTAYRGVKIPLPDQVIPLPVPVWQGSYYWWGGQDNLANANMASVTPIDLSAATAATLTFDLVYDIEDEWDFLWVQVSTDGVTWDYTDTLTNTNTQCVHDPGWVGFMYGFPEDLCAANIGGFYGYNANRPDPETQVFDLTPYAGQQIYLRFWYMTDWATLYTGAFIDNVVVEANGAVVFSDDAEAGDAKWTYTAPWGRYDGTMGATHNYYLQWRNVNDNGGYDSALGEERWRFGPANSGLLAWYNNNFYINNEIEYPRLFEYPSVGPKGRLLVIDAHPQPYRDPDLVAMGFNNEGGNLSSRGQMRDAPFTITDTVPFTHTDPYRADAQQHFYVGRPAASMFNDAEGYYPGAEYVNRGSYYPPSQFKWVTTQWDASTVIPAKAFYPLHAPGYPGGSGTSDDEFRWSCTPYLEGPYTGALGCYWFGAGVGLGYPGGTGNPGDYNVQYGWRAEVIEEGADHTWATLRIYNTQVNFDTTHTPDLVTTAGLYTVTYTTIVENVGSSDVNATVDYTLDNAFEAFDTMATAGTFSLTHWMGTLNPGAVVTLTVEAYGSAYMNDRLTTRVDANDGEARGPWFFTTDVDVWPITILHTNDFHGYLETDYRGRGGSAYMASKIEEIRSLAGDGDVALLDAGDIFLGGAPISTLTEGEASIDIYNMLGYDVAALGNHEFDHGQGILIERINQSTFPWVGANVVISGTAWDHPTWTVPYITMTVGPYVLGIIGLSTDETPEVTLKGTTDGLVFKDLTESVLHYYDEVMAASDAVIVLVHMGTENSGPYKGLVTIAEELMAAGKPIDLMIGGHQHQALSTPVVVTDTAHPTYTTYIVQAGYYGRYLGQVDASIDPVAKKLTLGNYTLHTINTTLPAEPHVAGEVAYWAKLVAPLLDQPVGVTNIPLVRDYNAESVIGDLVADSMLWKADAYDDGTVNGSVDIAFTNAGGLRADIDAGDITWGETFSVLPFGNTLYLMDLTGAQIQSLLDQSASLYKGMLQSSGIEFYWYNGNSHGAYGVMVNGQPLVRSQVYRVVTNNFLAPGGDGFAAFTQGTNRWDTYYDMQAALNEYIATITPIDAADIPMNRATRLDNVVTILHVNDTHGRWEPDSYHGGMAYIAALIKQERAKNPNALLLDAGDTFQGNSFAYFFKDSTPNPIAGGLNLLDFDATVLGNHEYNFGNDTFVTMLSQLEMPILGGANVDDDGRYGLDKVGVKDYITLTVNGLDVTIFGLTNPRVPRYELPSNIEGLTFYAATATAQTLVPQLIASENPDLLIALNHIGFDPYAGEPDSDLLVAQGVAGIDVIIGAHSHTKLDPAVMVTSTINPTGTLIAQAHRYADYLGKVNIGFTGNVTDGYEIVLREGYLIPATEVATPDPDLMAYLDPFLVQINNYNNTAIGQTTVPLDALNAFTEETNAANLQVDASAWELAQHGVTVDFHLSGAMTNRRVAASASATTPYTLTNLDMFNLMPYENSLVAIELNGAQLKSVLERSYWNWWNYTYNPGGDYSYYTTCFLDISAGGQIVYRDDGASVQPNGNNVVGVKFDGEWLDLTEATTYTVSSVNYVVAGSCNFNDDGLTIWPLDQLITDTQFYVRDAVGHYIDAQSEPIAPVIEGRIQFVTGEPDLSTSSKSVVDASGDNIAQAGEVLTYTITVSNTGDLGACFVLTDTLPAGLSYISGSLAVNFPGTGFVAEFNGNVLTAQTQACLPYNPDSGSLYMGSATLTFAAQVSDPAPAGSAITNTFQLEDQLQSYTIAPAVIPLPTGPIYHYIYLPFVAKNF